MFTESERNGYLADGLSEEEIDLLEDTLVDCETLDLLPDDIGAFIEEYKRKVPEDTVEGMKVILNSAIDDPDFFQKLMVLDEAMSAGLDNKLKLSKLEDLTPEEYKKASENYFKTFSSLSDKERKEFINMIVNLTEEQKKDMLERLKNN